MAEAARARDEVMERVDRELVNWARVYGGRLGTEGKNVEIDHDKPSRGDADLLGAEECNEVMLILKNEPRGSMLNDYWVIASYEYLYDCIHDTVRQKLNVSRATYFQKRRNCMHWIDGRLFKPTD